MEGSNMDEGTSSGPKPEQNQTDLQECVRCHSLTNSCLRMKQIIVDGESIFKMYAQKCRELDTLKTNNRTRQWELQAETSRLQRSNEILREQLNSLLSSKDGVTDADIIFSENNYLLKLGTDTTEETQENGDEDTPGFVKMKKSSAKTAQDWKKEFLRLYKEYKKLQQRSSKPQESAEAQERAVEITKLKNKLKRVEQNLEKAQSNITRLRQELYLEKRNSRVYKTDTHRMANELRALPNVRSFYWHCYLSEEDKQDMVRQAGLSKTVSKSTKRRKNQAKLQSEDEKSEKEAPVSRRTRSSKKVAATKAKKKLDDNDNEEKAAENKDSEFQPETENKTAESMKSEDENELPIPSEILSADEVSDDALVKAMTKDLEEAKSMKRKRKRNSAFVRSKRIRNKATEDKSRQSTDTQNENLQSEREQLSDKPNASSDERIENAALPTVTETLSDEGTSNESLFDNKEKSQPPPSKQNKTQSILKSIKRIRQVSQQQQQQMKKSDRSSLKAKQTSDEPTTSNQTETQGKGKLVEQTKETVLLEQNESKIKELGTQPKNIHYHELLQSTLQVLSQNLSLQLISPLSSNNDDDSDNDESDSTKDIQQETSHERRRSVRTPKPRGSATKAQPIAMRTRRQISCSESPKKMLEVTETLPRQVQADANDEDADTGDKTAPPDVTTVTECVAQPDNSMPPLQPTASTPDVTVTSPAEVLPQCTDNTLTAVDSGTALHSHVDSCAVSAKVMSTLTAARSDGQGEVSTALKDHQEPKEGEKIFTSMTALHEVFGQDFACELRSVGVLDDQFHGDDEEEEEEDEADDILPFRTTKSTPSVAETQSETLDSSNGTTTLETATRNPLEKTPQKPTLTKLPSTSTSSWRKVVSALSPTSRLIKKSRELKYGATSSRKKALIDKSSVQGTRKRAFSLAVVEGISDTKHRPILQRQTSMSGQVLSRLRGTTCEEYFYCFMSRIKKPMLSPLREDDSDEEMEEEGEEDTNVTFMASTPANFLRGMSNEDTTTEEKTPREQKQQESESQSTTITSWATEQSSLDNTQQAPPEAADGQTVTVTNAIDKGSTGGKHVADPAQTPKSPNPTSTASAPADPAVNERVLIAPFNIGAVLDGLQDEPERESIIQEAVRTYRRNFGYKRLPQFFKQSMERVIAQKDTPTAILWQHLRTHDDLAELKQGLLDVALTPFEGRLIHFLKSILLKNHASSTSTNKPNYILRTAIDVWGPAIVSPDINTNSRSALLRLLLTLVRSQPIDTDSPNRSWRPSAYVILTDVLTGVPSSQAADCLITVLSICPELNQYPGVSISREWHQNGLPGGTLLNVSVSIAMIELMNCRHQQNLPSAALPLICRLSGWPSKETVTAELSSSWISEKVRLLFSIATASETDCRQREEAILAVRLLTSILGWQWSYFNFFQPLVSPMFMTLLQLPTPTRCGLLRVLTSVAMFCDHQKGAEKIRSFMVQIGAWFRLEKADLTEYALTPHDLRCGIDCLLLLSPFQPHVTATAVIGWLNRMQWAQGGQEDGASTRSERVHQFATCFEDEIKYAHTYLVNQ